MKKLLFLIQAMGTMILFALPPTKDIQQYDPATTLFIEDSNKKIELPADGKDVVINGSKNTIHFTGVSKKLVIKGNNNDIDVDTVAAIEITGDYNFVAWKYGPDATSKPTVTDKGGYNNVGKRSGDALNKDEN
jgi:hypothetical protein